MGFKIPGSEIFSTGPDPAKTQGKYWNQMGSQLSNWKLPSNMSWNFGSMMSPYYQTARGDISGAYNDALSGLQGSAAWQNLMGGSDLNNQAMQWAMGQQRQGGKLMNEELARIAALDKGGWNLSTDANALAEIAPEVNAAATQFDDAIRGLEASGVRGGTLAALKYGSAQDRGAAVGNALQNAIRSNRGTKMGIANAKFGAQNLTMQDPQAMAAAQMLSGLYGQGAGALSGLGGQMFGLASGAEIGNLDRSSDLFKYLQQLSWGGGQAAADRAAQERQNTMSGISNVLGSAFSDSRLKTPPGEVKGVLSEIKHLPIYDYRYNEKAESKGIPAGTPGRGVMAQDLEKIPSMRHLVAKDPDGYRKVDVYGLTATALRAVQELDKKLDRIARSKAPKTLSRMHLR